MADDGNGWARSQGHDDAILLAVETRRWQGFRDTKAWLICVESLLLVFPEVHAFHVVMHFDVPEPTIPT
jgi:hypothetical protein